jgi:hypothetical protein
VDIARRHEGQTGLLAKGDETCKMIAIVGAGVEFHRDPRTPRDAFGEESVRGEA